VLSDRVDEYLLTDDGLESVRSAEAILSCGDLPYDYLEHLVTLLNVPLLFVLGNHDGEMLRASGATSTEPEGGTNLHGRVVAMRNGEGLPLLVAGLEGARRCGRESRASTDPTLFRHVLRMLPRLLWNGIRYGRAFDILITHAPPAGIHEGKDLCHRGFRVHRWLIQRFRPVLALHGHIHPSYGIDIRPARLGPTRVLNVYGSVLMEVKRA